MRPLRSKTLVAKLSKNTTCARVVETMKASNNDERHRVLRGRAGATTTIEESGVKKPRKHRRVLGTLSDGKKSPPVYEEEEEQEQQQQQQQQQQGETTTAFERVKNVSNMKKAELKKHCAERQSETEETAEELRRRLRTHNNALKEGEKRRKQEEAKQRPTRREDSAKTTYWEVTAPGRVKAALGRYSKHTNVITLILKQTTILLLLTKIPHV